MARPKIDEEDIIIGKRISSIRIHRGMSRNDLGKKIGISHQQIHKYENGSSKVSLTILKRLANVLDVSLYELIGVDGTMYDLPIDNTKKETILAIVKSIHKMSKRDAQVILATAHALVKE